MTSRTFRLIGLCFVLLIVLMSVFVQAQDVVNAGQVVFAPVGTASDPMMVISFPPPVYVLRDIAPIRGTVNPANLTGYFVEFRRLIVEDEALQEEQRWFPATLPATLPVIDGLIGEWNTNTAPDGLYQLRLTVLVANNAPQYMLVSPIRVENNAPAFAQAPARATLIPTFTPLAGAPPARPTLGPTPTGFDATPRVVALVDANVRRGDNTSYEAVGALLAGEAANIVGISSTGSGWYYVQLASGRRGFIAPSVVDVSGLTNDLVRYDPPAPPTPTRTPTPILVSNLAITGFRLEPPQPVCNEAFSIFINLANTGRTATNSGITIHTVDTHIASGSQSSFVVSTVPILEAQANYVVVIPMKVSTYYNEDHRLSINLDVLGQVAETDESDNLYTSTYKLQKGSCP